jgi:ketosteroid isomerase-like protein
MSRENVEVVIGANAAFNRGDVGAALDLFSPDAELQDLAHAPDQSKAVKGRVPIHDAWTLWTAAFDELRADIEEHTDEGDFVICAVYWHGRGKESGMFIDVRQFDVYEFREGQIVRATLGFRSKDEAVEATRPLD